ncbi:hypothetical protein O6H91_17G084900 [Diphasiastrum complanatum]|uniref:Uncharacterized protein n=1 Tax=Diphasiastrum complanatum TaxID=34168 RepID=A0ACC2B8W9_DIPCM|nr:hypothetical protein O6H91_17G084900 [Diphasiastrum complanatum]
MATSLSPAGYVVCQTPCAVNVLPRSCSQLCRGGLPRATTSVVYCDPFEKDLASLGRCLAFSDITQRRNASKTRLKALANILASDVSPLNGSSASEEFPVDAETQGIEEYSLKRLQPDASSSSYAGQTNYSERLEDTNGLEESLMQASSTAGEAPDASSVINIEQSPSSVDTAPNVVSEALKLPSNGIFQQGTNSMTDSFTKSHDSSIDPKSVSDAIQMSVDTAVGAVKHAYADVNSSILKAINDAVYTYEQTVAGVKSSITEGVSNLGGSIDLTSPFRDGSPINNALKVVVAPVKSTLGSALLIVKDALSELYTTTKDALPPELNSRLHVAEEYVESFFTPLSMAIRQAYSFVIDFEKSLGVDPDNSAIPVVLVIGLGATYLQFRYGGYSGKVQPLAALDLLRKEQNVVLVDIRPQELIESQGVPDLRRGTRSKFVSVEFMKVGSSVRRQLKNAGEIDNILTAAIIRNLKRVDSSTKVIVLDSDGNQSKRIAKALRKAGVRKSFVVEGGFEAWKESGLRSKPTVPETPFVILKEETEAIIEDVRPTPGGIVLVVIGFVSGLNALIEWEKTLQLIGVIGVGHAIYQRFSSYESVDDLKTDIRILQRPFKLAAQGVIWIAGQLEPNKLQLATSPSTSAVQDKVLQAAAKHGPVASELGQEQTPENASDES